MSCVPALFIVPMTVTSPSLIGSAVTMPSSGEVTVVLESESRLAARSAPVDSHALLGRGEVGLGRLEGRLGLLEVGLRQDVALEVPLGALVVELRLRGGGLRGVEVVAHRLQVGLAPLGLRRRAGPGRSGAGAAPS